MAVCVGREGGVDEVYMVGDYNGCTYTDCADVSDSKICSCYGFLHSRSMSLTGKVTFFGACKFMSMAELLFRGIIT